MDASTKLRLITGGNISTGEYIRERRSVGELKGVIGTGPIIRGGVPWKESYGQGWSYWLCELSRSSQYLLTSLSTPQELAGKSWRLGITWLEGGGEGVDGHLLSKLGRSMVLRRGVIEVGCRVGQRPDSHCSLGDLGRMPVKGTSE